MWCKLSMACNSPITVSRPKFRFVCIVFILIVTFCVIISIYGFGYKHEDVKAFKAKDDTTKETSAYSDNKEYAIMIDAGSSGSRIFIYTWPPHTGSQNQLLQIRPLCQPNGKPVIKKVEPGLSSVSERPWDADMYIYPLLEFASSYIPSNKHKITPLYILATAGLRLLDADTQNAILEDLKSDIPKNFSFPITENTVEVISGKQEGIFQWIAINYVLGRFNHNTSGPIAAVDVPEAQLQTPIFRKKTIGILDMGGASMQLAVELTTKTQVESVQREKKTAVTEINLGCDDHTFSHLYRVYVNTYLGMGANEVRDYYEDSLAEHLTIDANQTQRMQVFDPCLPAGLAMNLTKPTHTQHAKASSNTSQLMLGLKGTGDYDACRKSLQPLLRHLLNCSGTPCLAAQLPTYFEMNDFYGFSEFWYTMEDVLRIGGSYQFYKFRKAAKNFCATPWSSLEKRFQNHEYPLADISRLKYQCFKSAWLAIALHDGLGLASDFAGLRSSPNTVKGDVVHWTLGAAILKTRFLPLREIQKSNLHVPNKVAGNSWVIHLNNFTLVICFTVVLAAIFLYLQRLHCLKKFHLNKSSAQPLLSVHVEDLESSYLDADG